MTGLVHIIDDDTGMLRLLKELMASILLDVKLYSSAQSFLSTVNESLFGCILSDVRMPNMSGVELQQEIKKRDVNLPIIFLTGYGDVQMAVDAMQKEAFDFIEKPFNNQYLLDRVQKALKLSAKLTKEKKIKEEQISKYNFLTTREKDVFKLIASGEINKVVAHKLNISIKTVEVHRSRIMTKFNTSGIADLIKVNNTLYKN